MNTHVNMNTFMHKMYIMFGSTDFASQVQRVGKVANHRESCFVMFCSPVFSDLKTTYILYIGSTFPCSSFY